MVHGVFLWVRIWTERRRHQTADKKMTALPSPAKGHTLIPFIVGERFQYALLYVLPALDAAHIADKIARVSVYLSPFFIRQIWYGFYWEHPLS